MALTIQVTFDCADPGRVARFWADLLGYRMQPPPPGFETWPDWLRAQGIPEERWNDNSAIVDPEGSGPRFFFQRVPEQKTVKNRVHLDVNAAGPHDLPEEERRARLDAEVARAVSLGATELYRIDERDDYWVTLADPEGNEFCLQ